MIMLVRYLLFESFLSCFGSTYILQFKNRFFLSSFGLFLFKSLISFSFRLVKGSVFRSSLQQQHAATGFSLIIAKLTN